MSLDVTGEIRQQPSALQGVTMHGADEPRGQSGVPLSPLFEGRFGRMFRGPGLQIVDHDANALIALGRAMKEAPSARDNPDIPAAYTYLGQFIDHDITFDPASELQKFNDPDALVDFRTPRFDLDSLYGRGPSDSPYLYEWTDPRFRGIKLLAGRPPRFDPRTGRPLPDALAGQDLPRNEQGRALIGDPRNDENIIISQLHLAFIKLHDHAVDFIGQLKGSDGQPLFTGRALFEETQRWVRWHYQWMVVHDFLPRVCGQNVIDAILQNENSPTGPTIQLEFYKPENEPFIPVEFSVAAYRFGHSMIRPFYDLNEVVQGVPIFAERPADQPLPGPLDHLGGFRPLPAEWTIDWSGFVSIDGSQPQLSRRINTKLAEPLFKLPAALNKTRDPLAVLNLRRGKALRLPTAQSVAAKMATVGITPLTTQELGLGNLGLDPQHAAALSANTPLWYYILMEAERRQDGKRLGELGGRIVAEVLIGILQGDPTSYLRLAPTWKPPGKVGDRPIGQPGTITLADLLKFATR
jgi:hypothetical protein